MKLVRPITPTFDNLPWQVLHSLNKVDIYSISDNCIRESTLWLSGQSIGFLSGQTGFESQNKQEIFSAMLQ